MVLPSEAADGLQLDVSLKKTFPWTLSPQQKSGYFSVMLHSRADVLQTATNTVLF